MKLLALDTSTERASIALSMDGEVKSCEQPSQKQHAHKILPLIDSLLVDAGIGIQQLDGIVFGRGPGSFTGLRIACSVAKGLGFAHDIALFPASSLAVIAEEANNGKSGQGVLAMIDARMNQVYWACFHDGDTGDSEERVSFITDLVIEGDFPLVLAGIGFELYRANLPEKIGARIASINEIYPNATAMLRMAEKGLLQAVSAAEALPVYVRNQVVRS